MSMTTRRMRRILAEPKFRAERKCLLSYFFQARGRRQRNCCRCHLFPLTRVVFAIRKTFSVYSAIAFFKSDLTFYLILPKVRWISWKEIVFLESLRLLDDSDCGPWSSENKFASVRSEFQKKVLSNSDVVLYSRFGSVQHSIEWVI